MNPRRCMLVTCLLLLPGSVFGGTTAVQMDRGLASIEKGGPVPIRNRPPARRSLRGLIERRPLARPLAYVEPAEFGVLLEFDGTRDELEAAGIRVGTQVGRLFTARVRRDEIPRLRAVPGMRRVQLSRYEQPTLDVSAVDVHADLEHALAIIGGQPVYSGRAGQGVLVGLIDDGLDFTRPDFKDGSGKTRIVYMWDQTDDFGPHPAEFSYGSEYTRSDIDGSPGSVRERDFDGHGTLVAGVACGNGTGTGCGQSAYRYVGMAPLAEIISVKTDFSDAEIIDGVSYIFQKATALGKDCVVNLSLGGQSGPHDGSDVLSSALSALTGPGRLIVAAGGNSAADSIHGKLGTTSTTVGVDRFVISVPVYTPNSGTFNDFLLVAGWYDPAASVSVRVKGPGSDDSLSVGMDGGRDRITSGGKIFLINQSPGLGIGGTSTARQFEFGVYDSAGTNPPASGAWEIDVVANGASALGKRVDIWAYNSQLGVGGFATVTTGANDSTLVGEPADGDSILAVGAYATKLQWASCPAGGDCHYIIPATLGDIAYFSSPGPRRDGVLKPELTAPGFGIASVHSSQALPPDVCAFVDDGVHEISQGTSFSAPHVAGAAAIILQATPGATPSYVRLALEQHARQDGFTGPVPNTTWGYGKLDIYGSLGHVGPVVAVTSPDGGESWAAGSTQTVAWTASGPVTVSTVDIDYSLHDRAGPWTAIQHGVGNSGHVTWTLPSETTDSAVVRVQAHDAGSNVGTSFSGRFRIVPAGSGPQGVEFALQSPVPNPGAGNVQVRFTVPGAGRMVVDIVGVDGRLVWQRVLYTTDAGPYTVDWNGQNDAGKAVPSGIYFLKISSSFGKRTTRIVRVR